MFSFERFCELVRFDPKTPSPQSETYWKIYKKFGDRTIVPKINWAGFAFWINPIPLPAYVFHILCYAVRRASDRALYHHVPVRSRKWRMPTAHSLENIIYSANFQFLLSTLHSAQI